MAQKFGFSSDFILPSKETFLSAAPFAHIVCEPFTKELIAALGESLLSQEFARMDSDLYSFYQSDDITASSGVLQEFSQFLSSKDMLDAITCMTACPVTHADISGFVYDVGDYLLPHDDRLQGRKIAYVLYLSDCPHGGTLDLFACDDATKEPTHVVKQIGARAGQLVLFEVSQTSFHQVAEVLGDGAKRLSLAGWFYG